MARYTQDSKERVRDAVDMVELFASRTDIRRSGPGTAMARCPFHEERTASCSVDTQKKVYNCFGCGASGDCFRFVEELEGLDFKGAIEHLANRFGVELEIEDEDPEAARRREARERLLELLERTATYYTRVLWESKEAGRAREYLLGRGLTEEALRTFRVGYAPKAWDTVLLASRRAGYANREVFDAGLAVRAKGEGRLYDRFRGRIMFPLADRRGRVLGFGARSLSTEGPKYVNSPEGTIFHKREHLYGLHLARTAATRAGEVIVCEGYTDVIALHQAGMAHAVGQMGTALSEEQVAELARLAPVVHLALDADEAGQNAMLKAAAVARGRQLTLRVVQLPEGRDPADVVVGEGGPDEMRDLISRSVPFVRFRVLRELDRGDLSSAEGKDAVIDALRPVFADLPAGAVREDLVGLVADRLDIKPSLVGGWLSAAGPRSAPASPHDRPASSPAPSAAPNAAAAPPARRALSAVEQAERQLLAAVMALPQAGAAELERLGVEAAFTVPAHQAVARRLVEAAASDAQPSAPEDPALADLDDLLRAKAAFLEDPDELRAAVLAVEYAQLERELEHRRHSGQGGVIEVKQRLLALKAARDADAERRMGRAEEDD